MEAIELLNQMMGNPIIWAIILLALFCYGLLIELYFITPCSHEWFENADSWLDSLRIFVSALPLLGLLGTISGLLVTFLQMKNNHINQTSELMSGGIADALLTTQLGLLLAIPAWILIALLERKLTSWKIRHHIG